LVYLRIKMTEEDLSIKRSRYYSSEGQKPPLDEYESGAEIGWGSASENFFE